MSLCLGFSDKYLYFITNRTFDSISCFLRASRPYWRKLITRRKIYFVTLYLLSIHAVVKFSQLVRSIYRLIWVKLRRNILNRDKFKTTCFIKLKICVIMISIEVPLHNEHDNRTRVFTLICGAKWGMGVSRHLLTYSPRHPHPLCPRDQNRFPDS